MQREANLQVKVAGCTLNGLVRVEMGRENWTKANHRLLCGIWRVFSRWILDWISAQLAVRMRKQLDGSAAAH